MADIMTVTKEQAQMLATLACDLRPTGARQWKPDAVMAEIAKLRGRSPLAVALAVLRAAGDRSAVRPEVISSAGSHWGDTMLTTDWVPDYVDRAERCSVCSLSEPACRVKWHHDHDFQSVAIAAKQAADPAEHIDAIRAELAPTSGPTQRRTLQDLAEANPKLHERVEALRAANPGLEAPPMREPDPHTPHPSPPQPEPANGETGGAA